MMMMSVALLDAILRHISLGCSSKHYQTPDVMWALVFVVVSDDNDDF